MDKNEKVSSLLIDYYKYNGRRFAWRYNRSPYRVYLSEMLLQRTKAEQVAPVYNYLCEQYPDIKSLYSNFDNVKKALESLGRNCRLNHFINGLYYLLDKHNGKIPSETDKLLLVPGIGPYIAATIRLFGFGFIDTIIDTNVVRVVSRLYGLEYDAETRRDKEFYSRAKLLVPEQDAVEYSYGVLDFAASICKKRSPLCENCSIAKFCDKGSAITYKSLRKPIKGKI